MARPLRIVFEGVFYHVTTRGKEKVQRTSPYKKYAAYLAWKHTPFSNTEIGRYFGGISYSAVTKIGTKVKDRMRKDRKLREEMVKLQEGLSRVKG